jgi:hypothetical protein
MPLSVLAVRHALAGAVVSGAFSLEPARLRLSAAIEV